MINPQTAEWMALRKLIDKQIEQAQDILEGNPEAIYLYRAQGRIAALRGLIAEVEDP